MAVRAIALASLSLYLIAASLPLPASVGAGAVPRARGCAWRSAAARQGVHPVGAPRSERGARAAMAVQARCPCGCQDLPPAPGHEGRSGSALPVLVGFALHPGRAIRVPRHGGSPRASFLDPPEPVPIAA